MVKCTFVGQTVCPFAPESLWEELKNVKMKTGKAEKTKLVRKITVRFKEAEYKLINASFKRTTKRKLSEYIRFVLLEKPVTVYTRDKSIDDVMAQFILLKNFPCQRSIFFIECFQNAFHHIVCSSIHFNYTGNFQ